MRQGWVISPVEIKIQNVGAVGAISVIFMKDTCVFKYLVYNHVDAKISQNNVNIIVFTIITLKLYSCF